MSSFGLQFNGKHSYDNYNLIMRSIDRSLLPEVKRQQPIDNPKLIEKDDSVRYLPGKLKIGQL